MNERIGKYSIVETLGKGALGVVYRAYDDLLDRQVVIRTMADDLEWYPVLKLRFYGECQSLAGLHHPSIVSIYEIGDNGDIPYVVMELVTGQDLETLVQKKVELSVEKKLSIMTRVVEGLSHAHMNGIIHGGIKPTNIYVTPAHRVKISNLGLAPFLSSIRTPAETPSEVPLYLSPEQVRGEEPTQRSDVFSLGVVFYELFTYRHPFHDPDPVTARAEILNKTHLPTLEQFPEVPLGLWPILEKCLAKEPNDRYTSMTELSIACRELSEDLAEASELMVNEIQRAKPLLEEAVERSGAPLQLDILLRDVEKLLNDKDDRTHSSLQQLLATVVEHRQSLCPEHKDRLLSDSVGRQPASTISQTQSHDVPATSTQVEDLEPPPAPERAAETASAVESVRSMESDANHRATLGEVREAIKADENRIGIDFVQKKEPQTPSWDIDLRTDAALLNQIGTRDPEEPSHEGHSEENSDGSDPDDTKPFEPMGDSEVQLESIRLRIAKTSLWTGIGGLFVMLLILLYVIGSRMGRFG